METAIKETQRYMQERRMKGAQLERICGVPVAGFRRFLRGERGLSYEYFVKLNSVVGFSDKAANEIAAGKWLAAIMMEEAPCDKCRMAANCKQNRLACSDFKYYVDTGNVRQSKRAASRHLYVKVMAA